MNLVNPYIFGGGGGGGTRFYLPSSGAAAVSPAFSASWHQTGAGDRLIMSPTQGATAMASKAANHDSTAGARFILWRQYVSDPLDAQTISGTVKGQVYCASSLASTNPTLAVVIRVFSNDGSTERGVLLAISASQTTSDPPVFRDDGSSVLTENRSLKDSSDNTSLTLSPVAALAGDRLVIELGFRETGTSAAATSRGYFGEANANDAAENETDQNGGTVASNRNPWVEFTHTFDFQPPLPSDDFNRADSTTSLGTSSSGHTWVALTGTWGISSNKAYIDNSAGAQTIAYIESGDADVTIDVTLNKSDASDSLNRMGICFRISDSSNYLYAYYLGATGLRLFKVVAGVGTQIGTSTVAPSNGDVLRVITNGDQIEVYAEGILEIGPVTETHNQTATKHGLMWEAGGQAITVCRWDDFSIT